MSTLKKLLATLLLISIPKLAFAQPIPVIPAINIITLRTEPAFTMYDIAVYSLNVNACIMEKQIIRQSDGQVQQQVYYDVDPEQVRNLVQLMYDLKFLDLPEVLDVYVKDGVCFRFSVMVGSSEKTCQLTTAGFENLDYFDLLENYVILDTSPASIRILGEICKSFYVLVEMENQAR